MMESVDRLRKYVAANTDESYVLTSYPPQHRVVCLTMINDLIDAIEREVEEQIEERYVELPKDMNGECIHIGDELDCGKVSRIEITSDGDHKVYFRTRPDNPHLEWRLCRYVHHKPTTVEGVLEEFASERIKLFLRTPMAVSDEGIEEYRKDNYEACEKLIAEYAAKLQLKEAE